MAFTEKTKLEAKQKAHFKCVACRKPFVEVHHLIPESQGGSDELENACPLCSGCHGDYGGNLDKRKQWRQMRDFWWERCGQDLPQWRESFIVCQKLDEFKNEFRKNRQHTDNIFKEIKTTLSEYYTKTSDEIDQAETLEDVVATIAKTT